MQTSPISPTPQLRSGRALPASRSSSETPIRVLIGDADGEFRRALRASFAADPRIEVVGDVFRRRGNRAGHRIGAARDLRGGADSADRGRTPMKPTDSDFYDTVVCELRQPLTVLNGQIQLAKRLLETDPSRTNEALDQVVTQIARINLMLVELRDRARDAEQVEALFKR